VFIDSGLTANDWYRLELGGWVDIVQYRTKVGDMEYSLGGPGLDCWNAVNCMSPVLEREHLTSGSHTSKVLVAFGTIARGAPVIVIDDDIESDYGYHMQSDLSPWEWILNNIDTYQIKVVSISQFFPILFVSQVNNLITQIHNKGVIIVSSMGNDGRDRGDRFPQSHPYVYGISSIDHENRGGWRDGGFFGYYYDSDYKSRKGYFSGLAEEAGLDPVNHQGEHENCDDPHKPPFCSSYGSISDASKRTDFVMPGHGVLTGTSIGGVFTYYYSYGTSFSAPYLAAAALLVHHAYAIGANKGTVPTRYPFLSVDTVLDLLKSASSRVSWHRLYGWGYIDLYKLFVEAKELGKPICDALMIKMGLC
ncbi:MAG: hypothetical protein D6732_00800, partial [Methanobacteriota archaeon]